MKNGIREEYLLLWENVREVKQKYEGCKREYLV